MKYISIVSILFLSFFTFTNINAVAVKSRIIGGRPTKSREIKYLVGIYRNNRFICGGGIIGQKYILTAAHCVVRTPTNEFKPGKFKIIAGLDSLNDPTPSVIEINVKKCYVPKVYNATLWKDQFPDGDIAVLELKDKLNLTNTKDLKKLMLPSQAVRSAPNDSGYKTVSAVAAAFGNDNFTAFTDENGEQQIKWKASRKLLKAKVKILDRSVCEKSYTGKMPKAIICGRVQNYLDGTYQGICSGDSGSPLVQNGTIVIGVISGSSTSCNDNKKPSIYTKTASFKKFIKNVKQGIDVDMRVLKL